MALAQAAPWQGGNKVQIFALTTTGLFDTALATYNRIIDSTVTGIPAKGACKIALTNKQWETSIWEHLSSYVSDLEVTETKIKYEDGATETLVSGVTTSKTFGVIYYQGNIGTSRPVFVGRGVYSGATGDSKMVAENIGDFPIEITLISGLQVVVPSAKFDTTLMTVSNPVTVTTTSVGTLISATSP